jgi:hypothetical protein
VPRAKKASRLLTADPYVMRLLQNTSKGKTLLALKEGERIFDQGDRADAIFFI